MIYTFFSLIYTWYIDTLDWPANSQANLGGPVKVQGKEEQGANYYLHTKDRCLRTKDYYLHTNTSWQKGKEKQTNKQTNKRKPR